MALRSKRTVAVAMLVGSLRAAHAFFRAGQRRLVKRPPDLVKGKVKKKRSCDGRSELAQEDERVGRKPVSDG